MRNAVLLILAVLALSACASEINKPIGPDDRWADSADLWTGPVANN